MSIITHKFRTSNTNDFKEDFVNSNYYVFASSTNISQTRNTDFSKNEFLENTLFGKKVDPADVFYVIDSNRWINGTIYEQYDNTVDLLGKKFYVIIYPSDNNTGDYKVYKCLFNNHGAKSTNAPNYDPDTDDQIYRMNDGYIWKYMYSISTIEFQKYNAIGYAPVIGTSSSNTVNQCSIDYIEVENYDLNKGYELRKGTILEVLNDDIVIYSSDLNLSEISSYYTGQNFYVIDTDNVAQVYTIDTYSYNVSTQKATIRLLDKNSFIEANFSFKIFPRIEIKGDGTDALAIPNIDSLGTIKSTLILNKGSGYTRATARIVTPLYGFDTISAVSTDVEATLRPILSPIGGHATNFAEELLSRRAIVYVDLTDTDNLSIPSTNRYTKLGLVKNPEFTSNTSPELFDNRLELGVSSNVFTVGEIATQASNGITTFSGEVHETGSGVIYLCNYHGPYQNYDIDGYFDIAFDETRSIISSQNQIVNINNIIRPTYVQKTGDVYYMTIFSPITRTSTSNEEYKIILEF
jgi:hypothetical protein